MHSTPPSVLSRVLTVTTVALLASILVYGSSELLHGQMLKWGEGLWNEYHGLRHDPVKPDCDIKVLEGEYARAKNGAASTTTPAEGEDDLLDGLVDDAPAPGSKAGVGDDLLDDLIDDDGAKPESDDALLDDLVQDQGGGTAAPDEDATEDDDLLDGLVDEPLPGKRAGKTGGRADAGEAMAWKKALALCREKQAIYRAAQGRIDDSVRRYRSVEKGVAALVSLVVAHMSHILALLFLLCGLACTLMGAQIALRSPITKRDHLVSNGSQLVANGLMLYSWNAFRLVEEGMGTAGSEGALPLLWVSGFGVLCAANVFRLFRGSEAEEKGPWGRSLLSVPLYAWMAIISGSYFLLVEGHKSGLAIYLSRLTEHAILYLHVGLYVWVGMLLKETQLARLSFDVARPWKMPPELLAFVAVVAAAIPTAYSGASGIFVIAAGGVIYEELRRAGARRQLALAATAMAGSMGVVLRPCLLVVVVASLNKLVTTDQLFKWGIMVFFLTAFLFLIVTLLTRKGPMELASPAEAKGPMFSALGRLVPYVIVLAVFLALYGFGLNGHLDEHSAPVMLPLLLLLFLIYEGWQAKRGSGEGALVSFSRVYKKIDGATHETTGHIGALLLLMGLSVCLGGIIERSDIMSSVPESFGSPWLTMGLLVGILVVVGMIMDPYGAVILVSATLADVAYRNGIDPVHFWMVVLVAFELGYLTPPVALNHLLTRQVVGAEEVKLAAEVDGSFWMRHEKILLPISVMASALVLVAFGPLLFS